MTDKVEKFTKKDLLEEMGKIIGGELDIEYKPKQIKAIFDGMEDLVIQKVKVGWKVDFFNLCFFQKVRTKARMGRNPATGEQIKIKAKTKIKATLKKAFKDAVA
jgi:DNA-binding protein HU-beta